MTGPTKTAHLLEAAAGQQHVGRNPESPGERSNASLEVARKAGV